VPASLSYFTSVWNNVRPPRIKRKSFTFILIYLRIIENVRWSTIFINWLLDIEAFIYCAFYMKVTGSGST